ncbi:MAG: UDP-N-acetylmuramoyl-tripeptide--D-alanyl-D-alanine ligase [Burkholderiales bacterium]|nr:UDP-N-acetylmuramoyl-tripeptide--D-alanyl-D-alanine ligase [Burkholderiales bacterium]
MMSLREAAMALGARQRGADVLFTRVHTDSRTVVPGDLFVALRGERFDALQFLGEAQEKGAVAALVGETAAGIGNRESGIGNRGSGIGDRESEIGDRGSEIGKAEYAATELPLLLVEDTRLALGKLAAYWRGKFAMPLVALTGSNGKTTVKEMLASILRVADRANAPAAASASADSVLATSGNLNNDIGVPLTLLGLRTSHRYAVIEMGMNHLGEIAYLSRLAKPDVALVNNAAAAHLEGLGSVESVARAKGEIFEGLNDDGVAVINSDDVHAPLWRKLAGKHRTLAFGLDTTAQISARYTQSGEGSDIIMRTPGGEVTTRIAVPGAHNVRNALAASAAAIAVNIDGKNIAAGLREFSGVKGRLQRKPARRGAMLIDDSYNANPASMRAAIAVLAAAPGKKIFVLGDMGELGSDAEAMHAALGDDARAAGINRLFALGELSRAAVARYGSGAQHLANVEDLIRAVDAELTPGTTVLVKGSRFMKMERVVVALQDEGGK